MKAEIVVAPREELARLFVADLEREVHAAPPRTRFTLAVPGGSVGDTFFPHLALASLDWRGIDVFWTDERAVPPESAESNYALARRLWLVPAGVPATNVHRMPADEPDLRLAAETYAAALRAAAGSPPHLDYALAGVGDDGHVASVFPHDLPGHATAPVTVTERAPKPPPRRMTLSLATLAAARRLVIAAFDASKAHAVAAALEEMDAQADAQTPAGALLRAAQRPLVLLTPAAVGR